MGSLRASVAGLGLVVSLLVPTLAAAAEAPSARKSVLLLYAESRVVPAIFRLDESIRSRFVTAGVAAEFFPEYLDLSWAAEPGHTTDLLAFLRSKHRRRKFDVVMAAGSTALRFALASRAELFPGVPIVFCAVTRAGTDGLQLDRDVTGVWMVPEAAATVARSRRSDRGSGGLVSLRPVARPRADDARHPSPGHDRPARVDAA
jgi:two-component system, cell cycle sensor histidine kinase and response regulator CckA